MTRLELDKKLLESLDLFSEEMRAQYQEDDNTPASRADIDQCARQTYYALNDFRKHIIEYLKTN